LRSYKAADSRKSQRFFFASSPSQVVRRKRVHRESVTIENYAVAVAGIEVGRAVGDALISGCGRAEGLAE